MSFEKAFELALKAEGSPTHKHEDNIVDAWSELKRLLGPAKAKPELLAGHAAEDMARLMWVAVDRWQKKKASKPQAAELLKVFLESPHFLLSAQASELLVQSLSEIFEKDSKVLEKLNGVPPELPEEEVKEAAVSKLKSSLSIKSIKSVKSVKSGTDSPRAEPATQGERAEAEMQQGWEEMAALQFEFASKITGLEVDKGSSAFDSFFSGMQRQPKVGDLPDFLNALTPDDYMHLMQFVQKLNAIRATYIKKIKFVIRKMGEFFPAFEEVSFRSEWGVLSTNPEVAARAQKESPGTRSSDRRGSLSSTRTPRSLR